MPDQISPSADASDIRLESFLCFALYTASHAFTRFYKPLLDELGLTYPQYLALVTLDEAEALTVGQIGARLSLESSTLTPLLKRLEAAGAITRTRSQQDERQVRVQLTEAGRAILGRARALPSCVATALDRTPAELQALKNELDSLRQRLDAQSADPQRPLLPA